MLAVGTLDMGMGSVPPAGGVPYLPLGFLDPNPVASNVPVEPPEPAPGAPLLSNSEVKVLSSFFDEMTQDQYAITSFGEGLSISEAWLQPTQPPNTAFPQPTLPPYQSRPAFNAMPVPLALTVSPTLPMSPPHPTGLMATQVLLQPAQLPPLQIRSPRRRRRCKAELAPYPVNQDVLVFQPVRRRLRSPPQRHSPPSARIPRENLSEEQKRENHIRSEQKRRTLIRVGFEDLCKLVPALKGGGFSKSAMLCMAADWLEEIVEVNHRLEAQLNAVRPCL